MKKSDFHVKPIGLLDMVDFKNAVPRRRAILENGSLDPITSVYGVNKLAKSLHPAVQEAEIAEIIERKDAKTFVLKADKLAYFRAGQYISVKLNIGNAVTARPYTLAASPKDALNGRYEITVKKSPDGFVSDFILNNWKVGTKVTLSGPEGPFSYEELRDEKNVVGLAGGSGITPFMSMIYAIRDGIEDFNLTLLYGSKTQEDILYKDELDALCKETDKVKVVYILSDEKADGFESGFIGEDIIRKYSPEKYSLYICGPRAMHDYLNKDVLPVLGLDEKHIRKEFVPAPSDPGYFDKFTGDKNAVYSLTVIAFGDEQTVPLRADETILTAIERAGISAPSRCRSGECGWCRSRLVSGEVFIPESLDGRRLADADAGYIHPCSSWALSDVCLEIFPE